MSEPENFIERWSRRKLANAEAATPAQEDIAPPADQEEDVVAATPASAGPSNAPLANSEDKPFDPASLPAIDSIGADTDVTAFLRPGVPPDLTRAALRRAWSSDPAIRDFVGLVENGWDFNDPNAMAGFGSIGAGEAARLLAQAMGELPELAEKVLAALPKSALDDGKEQTTASDDVHRNTDVAKNDAPQKDSGA